MTVEPNPTESPSSLYIPSQTSPRVQRSEILIERQWRCTVEDLLPQKYYIPDVTISNLTKRALAELAESHSVEEVRKALIDILEARQTTGRLDFARAVLTAQMQLEKGSRHSESRVDDKDEMPSATKRKRHVAGRKSTTTTPRATPRKRQRLQTKSETPNTQTKTAPKKKKKMPPGWKGYSPVDDDGNVVELYPSSSEEGGAATEHNELSMDDTPNSASNAKSENQSPGVSRPSLEIHRDETDSQATQYVEDHRIDDEEMVDGSIDHPSTPDPLHHLHSPTRLVIPESTKAISQKTPVTLNGASATSSTDSNDSIATESLRSGRRSQETTISSTQPSPTPGADAFVPSSANTLKISYLISPTINGQSPRTPTQAALNFRPMAPMVAQAFPSPGNQYTSINSEENAAQQLLELSNGSPQSRSPRNGGTPAKPPSTPIQTIHNPQSAETAVRPSTPRHSDRSTPTTPATKHTVVQSQVQSTAGAQPAKRDDQRPSAQETRTPPSSLSTLEDVLKDMQASLYEPLQQMRTRVDARTKSSEAQQMSLEAVSQELKSTSANFQNEIVKMGKLRKEYQQAISEYRKHRKITETCRDAIVANDGTAGYQNIINDLRENLFKKSKGLPPLKQQYEDNIAGMLESVGRLDEVSRMHALALGQLQEIEEEGKSVKEELRQLGGLSALVFSMRQDPKLIDQFLEFYERTEWRE